MPVPPTLPAMNDERHADIRAGVRLIEARKVAKALKHVRGAAAPR